MRALLLTGDQPNQRALANKLAQVCDLAGIALSRNIPRRRPDARARLHAFITALEMRTFGRPLRSAWLEMQRTCEAQFPSFPQTRQMLRVDNVNDPATLELVSSLAPDLILVSGTNLVGRRLIVACGGIPILNLHTGVSPYVKGGPNCTNWCLAEELLHLIGSTVMWLDPGIDSGDIIASERAPLTFTETLGELQLRVMDHAHHLYVRCVRKFESEGALPRVPQDALGPGRTFFNKDWDRRAMVSARRSFVRIYSPILLSDPAFLARINNVAVVALSA